MDLSGGQQPLSNQSGTTQTVINGELYNFEEIRADLKGKGYKFKTQSDSEIIPHLYDEYGLSFLDHLRGEFAFTMWEERRKRLIVARDRFGIKPVYYTVHNGTLLVASEIKAFIPLGWKAEWDMDSVVNNGAWFDYRTCFKGVYKLPPAHYLIANASGTIQIRPYWDADYPDKNVLETRTVEEMIQGVRSRLVDAVEQRLISDVPVGVYLSGGIDSSVIAGVASKIVKSKNPDAKLTAFTISFVESEKYNELAIAERTAEFCGIDLKKLVLTEEAYTQNFEEAIWHFEQPQANFGGVSKFLLSKLTRDSGYKVVLTGEGSDEHFGGYSFFTNDLLLEPDLATPNGFGTLEEAERKKKLNHVAAKTKHDIDLIMGNENSEHGNKSVVEDLSCARMVNNITTQHLYKSLFLLKEQFYNKSVIEHCGKPDSALAMVEAVSGIARNKVNNKWHPLHTSMYLENHTLFPNYICNMLGDRSEMAHSVEARTPFLDHPLCEYVNGLPPSVKIKVEEDGSFNEKWILKQASKPFITEEMYQRVKLPFTAPAASKSKREHVANLLDSYLTKEKVSKLGWLNYKVAANANDEFLKTDNVNILKDLLMIVSYIIIAEQFKVAAYNVRHLTQMEYASQKYSQRYHSKKKQKFRK